MLGVKSPLWVVLGCSFTNSLDMVANNSGVTHGSEDENSKSEIIAINAQIKV